MNSIAANLYNKIKLFTIGEPQKTLIKAGLMTLDDQKLTEAGRVMFRDWLFNSTDLGTQFATYVATTLGEIKAAEKAENDSSN